MDKEVWTVLRNAIRSADRSVTRTGRSKQFSRPRPAVDGDQQVVKMYFWTVVHDRPRCFASYRSNYNSYYRPRSLPSYSQFCRRLHSSRIISMIEHVHHRLARSPKPVQLAFIDGKALPISESSKDPDARTGRGNGRFSLGYKLHAFAMEDGRIPTFFVHPMNDAEPRVSRERMVPLIPPGLVVLADGNYDSKFLYDGIRERGSLFFAPPRQTPQQRRSWDRTSEARRIAVEIWEQHPHFAKQLYQLRGEIERIFSRLTCFGGGLGPLPSWVRRIDRVTLWVTSKIAIYHARLIVRERNTKAA